MSLEFSPSLHERARSKWNGGETHSVQVTFTPVNNVNASHDMLERATKSFRDLPPEVRQLLLKHSVSFVTTDTMPDAAKNFWGPWFVQSFRIQLRGYPEGATWENNSGYTSGSTVYMSERLRDLASGQMYKDGGVESTVRHESGHEVDKLLCEISKCSDSSEFKTAYANDLARIPDSDKPELQYFLQRAGGRSETFAEVFAAIVGGGAASERESELIAKYFSETRAYVQTKIDGLK